MILAFTGLQFANTHIHTLLIWGCDVTANDMRMFDWEGVRREFVHPDAQLSRWMGGHSFGEIKRMLMIFGMPVFLPSRSLGNPPLVGSQTTAKECAFRQGHSDWCFPHSVGVMQYVWNTYTGRLALKVANWYCREPSDGKLVHRHVVHVNKLMGMVWKVEHNDPGSLRHLACRGCHWY